MHLAPHIAVADFGDQAVVLDIRADRYRLVGARKAAVLAAISEGRQIDDIEAIEALRAEGMLTRTRDIRRRRQSLSAPIRSALEMAPVDGPAFEMMQVARATVEASLRLRFASLHAVLAWAVETRREAKAGNPTVDTIIALSQSFDRLRAQVPLGRICLRDSLALHALLGARGYDCQLVFGVRLDPFGAHCWVQSGEVILSDTLGAVHQMRPILLP